MLNAPRLLTPVLLLTALLLPGLPTGAADDVVGYATGPGKQSFDAVLPLSDGSLLIGGGATDLSFVPEDVPRTELAGPAPQSAPTGRTPFLLHVSGDLQTLHRLVTLPKDCARAVEVIKTTSTPGQPTGDLYIGGRRDKQGKQITDGYFIAKLDGNFVDGPPTKLLWTRDVRATGALKDDQSWDVGGDGKVVYAEGEPYSYDWMAVYRLTADGEDDVVPEWRTHWGVTADGEKTEFAGAADQFDGRITKSGIVLKIWGRGDFRSWNKQDYLLETPDGNGGVKQGKWPFDAMYDGYYDPQSKETAEVRDDGKGYYGYRWGTTPCAHVGAIVIDRRTNGFYIGGNNKSKLPGGNPDFEPWVVAMSPDGELRWWQRLYAESEGVSTPDQYVDALAIDDRASSAGGEALVVVARAHGNNVNNFWGGDEIKHPDNPGRGFQNGFTGTHGNMHFSWLGRMTLAEGTMLHATYLAEYAEGAKHGEDPFNDPLLAHWPRFSAGWPDLNTTRVEPHGLRVDEAGRVYVLAQGRRVITTANAFMEMPSPLRDKGARGNWADFVRVYKSDLTGVFYASILAGRWDWQTAKGGSKVDLRGLTPVEGGLLSVGVAPLNKQGMLVGNPMPTANLTPWLSDQRIGESAVIARFRFER